MRRRTLRHCWPTLQRHERVGLTLLEVLISLAILGAALTAIGQITSNGVTAGLRCEQETEAAWRCQSQVDLLLAGTEPIREVRSQLLADDRRWQWSATIAPAMDQSLVTLTVVVERVGSTQVRYELTRLIRRSRMEARRA